MTSIQKVHSARSRHKLPAGRRRDALTGLRIVLALTATIALTMTGAGWWYVRGALGSITVSQALGANEPRSSGTAINILLIGLDSRKDQDGNDLPQEMLDNLHAGESDDGGYNTNTLVLAHISADNKVTAFSIPRDDYVTVTDIPGYHKIKIKQAYGLKKAYAQQKLADQGIDDQRQLEQQGREAGRKATLSAVRNLTGAPIDYFAETNLAGFYDLAQSMGGIEVCLNEPVYDDFSGANFPAGHQTLNAAQTLAFVRQRHGLDNGDLDRTHRQQAFLVSVMNQLQRSGAFTNLGKLNDLIAIAHKDIVLSSGWDERMFRRIGAINGNDFVYRTLPVLRYDTVNGEDVNVVDPKAIKREVAKAFSDGHPPSPSATPGVPTSTVDVVNAGSTSGLASTVSRQLTERGYKPGDARDPVSGERTDTSITYGEGAEADAQQLATTLGIDATPEPDSELAPGHIRAILGEGYTAPSDLDGSASDTGLGADISGADSDRSSSSSITTSTTTTSTTAGTTTSTDPTPDHGKPLAGGALPCVN